MLLPAHKVSRFETGTPKALNDARAMQNSENNRGTRLVTQAGIQTEEMIYVYNIFQGWKFGPIEQPPTFPRFQIPFCPRGTKFVYTTLPRYVNDPKEDIDKGEIYYNKRDGREAANSLMNPDSHPGNPFEAQFRDIEQFGNRDQTGNNKNAYGVFWSLTEPDDPALDEELAACRKRLDITMRGLLEQGNTLNAAGNRGAITPLMHHAMEYFNLQAEWHMSTQHKVPCPNCGEPVLEGLAYHRNQFGDRCIIDLARYRKSIGLDQETAPTAPALAPAPPVQSQPAEIKDLDEMSDEELAAVATAGAGEPQPQKPAKKRRAQ